MKYNVLKFITNSQGQYSATVDSTFNTFNGAKVTYHQALAALNNADDVNIAVVKIVDEYGNEVDGFREVVDHVHTAEV